MLAALALAWLSACGGHPTAPSGPPTPAPSPPPSPVPAAPGAVAVLAADGITGASVMAGPSSAVPGSVVEVSAGGYLVRRTVLPADGRVFLWPLTVDEAYVRRIVYETWSFSGVQRLYRWSRTALTISPGVPSASIAEIASTGAITLAVGEGTPDIEVRVDPSDPDLSGYLGFTRCSTRGYAIDHCKVVLRDEAVLRSTVTTHELGHCLGLGHSARAQDLMHPGARTAALTPDERVLVAMMYARRRPGNAPPDDDAALGPAGASRRVLMIRD